MKKSKLKARLKRLEKRMDEIAPVERTVQVPYESDSILGNNPTYDSSILMNAIKDVNFHPMKDYASVGPVTNEGKALSKCIGKEGLLKISVGEYEVFEPENMFGNRKDDLLKAIINVYENRK